MKILFISNFYPPAREGGYAQLCEEVSAHLMRRGHEVHVLTSRFNRHSGDHDEKNVYRLLHLESDPEHYGVKAFFGNYLQHRAENSAFVDRTLDKVEPDVVVIWGMWLVSKDVPALLEKRMGSRVVYYLADYWPMEPGPHVDFWDSPVNRPYLHYPKKFLAAIAKYVFRAYQEPDLRFQRAICVSSAVRKILASNGVPVSNGIVIHNGSNWNMFRSPGRSHDRSKSKQSDGIVRLVYAGQLVPHKGVHTAIHAANHLLNSMGIQEFQLEIVGSGPRQYTERLRDLSAEYGLTKYVRFSGWIPRQDLPAILTASDILVFPSIYEEPLARITQEGMAAGMVVVGTSTGGTPEILEDGENGLMFEAGDSWGLACHLRRLIQDPDLRDRLANSAIHTVQKKFTLERMIDEMESYLQAVDSGIPHDQWRSR